MLMQRLKVRFTFLETTSSLQAFEIDAGDLAGKTVVSGYYHFIHETVKEY